MVKIQVSYTEEKELQEVIRKLGAKVRNIKRKNNKEGKYKRAYIVIDIE